LFNFALKAGLKKATRFLLRFLKIIGIVLASVLLILFLAPYIFPDTVGKQIKHFTNQSIKGEINFSRARLSFFTHFPSLTLTLFDVDLKGSAPFEHDTLIIEKMKFKTGGFRIRFEGQTSFENKVNFKMRIGLPPLGIIGIRITGSSDNPKIKLGKSDTDPLQEKSDE
jgi:hypothetical protein